MCLTAFVRGGRSPTLPHNDARLHSASQLHPITHRAAHSEQLQGSSGGSAVQCEGTEAVLHVQYPYGMSPFDRA